MKYLMSCQRCRGEGFRTEPPYDPKFHDRPMMWRENKPCWMCNGTGTRPATDAEIRAHKAAIAQQYSPRGFAA